MNGTVTRADSARLYSRALILSGTALGTVLISTAATAQNVTYNGAGDYTLTDSGTIAGGPRTVDVTVNSGNIAIDVNRVEVTNNGTATGAGIAATNTGAGNISIKDAVIVASGTGPTNGIDARVMGGNVTINSGTVTSHSNPTSRGIQAISAGGNITIVADRTYGGQRGIFTGSNAGVFPNSVTITSNVATANGLTSPNAIVGQGQTVTINSGTATNTNTSGNSGTAIFANAGTGGAFVTSGTAEALGNGQSAIQVYSDSTVQLNSTAARTTQSSDGLSVQSGTVIGVNSGTVNTTGANGARGIVMGGSGNGITYTSANVTSGTITTTGANSYGIYATPTSGATTLTGASIATQGQNAYGIYVTPVGTGVLSGATTINGGTITTAGNNAVGLFVNNSTGPVTVDATSVTTGGLSAIAIDIRPSAASTAPVAINAGTVRTTGASSTGIVVGANAGSATVTVADVAVTGVAVDARAKGDVVLTSGKARSGTGNTGLVAISANGAATANSIDLAVNGATALFAQGRNSVTVNSDTLAVTGANQVGISAQTSAPTAVGLVSVTSNSLTTEGGGITVNAGISNAAVNNTGSITNSGTRQAIRVQTTSGSQTIASNVINTTGFNGVGIAGFATGGAITVNSTAINTSGVGAQGIYAQSTDGDVSVTSGSVVTTGTGYDTTSGQTSDAIAAISRNGAVNVTSGNASTAGDVANAIFARGGRGVTITSDTATGTGADAPTILGIATNGAVVANVGSARATGAGSDAIYLIANGAGGAVTANIIGTVSAVAGIGLRIDPPGAVIVNVASGASVSGLTGIDTIGGTNTITNLGTITGTAGPGIVASGATTLVNAGSISGANNVAVRLGDTNDSVTLLTGSTVNGRIVGGGGTDAALLSGTGTVAGFDGFDSLTVQSGYWTGNPDNSSAFNTATIDQDATLEVANGATGTTGVTAATFVDNGTLVVRSSSASASSTFGASTVSGSGVVALTGAGTITLDGTNSVATTGGITVDGGSRLLVTGSQGGAIATGTGGTLIVGSGGTTGEVTGSVVDNGMLIVNRSDDYTFAAALTGTGSFIKQGAGKVTFGSNYGFTGETTIQQGAIKLSTVFAPTTELDLEGNGQLDLSGTSQTVAELQGSSTGASINIDAGGLTVNQATSTVFAGSIVGNGTLTKTGTGTLNLTGTSTYTGPTTVSGGVLAVNGSISSPVAVTSGGTLGGTGSVGSVTIGSGGTYAPGNSIGTQIVNGNVAFATGSIFEVEVNAAGQSDWISATGSANIAGGTVQVLAAPGVYAPLTSYTILTAATGVTGRFANATTNMAFLTPNLSYGANNVLLTLGRNDISFASQASGSNQLSVANAVASLGLGNPIYNAVLVQTTTGAQTAFQQLSGEIHPAVSTVLIDGTRRTRDSILAQGRVGVQGIGLWADGLQTYAQSRSQEGVAKIRSNRTGVLGGVDFGFGGLRLGVNGGYGTSDVELLGRASTAEVTTTSVGGSLGWVPAATGFALQVGGTYAWHEVDTSRTIGIAGLAGTSTSSSRANTAQVFGEAGYSFQHEAFRFAPFVRYAHVWTDLDAMTETGGLATLAVSSESLKTNFASVGLRLNGSSPLSGNLALEPHATIDYTRAWGDRAGVALAFFSGATAPFGVTSARIGQDTLNADIGLDLVSGNLRIGVAGVGSVSSEWNDYGAKVSVAIRF